MFLYNGNRLENILNKVDEGLGTKEDSVLRTPNILRTIIARNSPDVYLLLMDMARKDMESLINLSACEIKAQALMLHWFGNDKKLCVQEIFHQFKNGIIAPLFGDNLWSHPFHAKTKTIAIDTYFIFYKRHYRHKIIVYKRQNIQKEFYWESNHSYQSILQLDDAHSINWMVKQET